MGSSNVSKLRKKIGETRFGLALEQSLLSAVNGDKDYLREVLVELGRTNLDALDLRAAILQDVLAEEKAAEKAKG